MPWYGVASPAARAAPGSSASRVSAVATPQLSGLRIASSCHARRPSVRPDRLVVVLVALQQAEEHVGDRSDEDDRLLRVHEDAAQILVLARRQPPEARRLAVERV